MNIIFSPPITSIVDLREGVCRWPTGDPKNMDTFSYCGASAEFDRPYCQWHCALAYIPNVPRVIAKDYSK